ncbi:hypothetical protein CDPAHKCJ_02165 [Cobetia sp. MB87]|nr:hypothetical protein [Cobetia sp. MB87]
MSAAVLLGNGLFTRSLCPGFTTTMISTLTQPKATLLPAPTDRARTPR